MFISELTASTSALVVAPARNTASTPACSYALTRLMVSARSVILRELVRPATTMLGSRRAARAAFIFPTPSSMGSTASAPPPKVRGRTVSSMVKAATPAVSNSSTVRITFNALPYPWSASTIRLRSPARQMRWICWANSVRVRTMRSGAPRTVPEAMDPANMPTSKPRSSAIRAEIGSKTDPG